MSQIPPNSFAIAIDGPGGVGKSTIARKVAANLDITYIDTGAMYRAVALHCIRQNIDITDEAVVSQLLPNINIGLTHKNGQQFISLNGEDITSDIRTQAISDATSVIAAYSAVRAKMVVIQQCFAASNHVVMDGRDIASQVLPWAQLKIYLDAHVDVRARRRTCEMDAKGQPANFETIREEISLRDQRDKTRTNNPLIHTPDAVYIDNGDMTIAEQVDKISALARPFMQNI